MIRSLGPRIRWVARRWMHEIQTGEGTPPKVVNDPYSEIPELSFNFETSPPISPHVESIGGIDITTDQVDNLGFKDARVSLAGYFHGDIHHSHKIFSGHHHNYKMGQKIEQRTFMDLRLLRLKSGDGGNGSVSFFRDAHRPVGPPDGGDGGEGGLVYVSVVEQATSLHYLKRSYTAGSGKAGASSQLDGKRGNDVIIEVPVGTTVRWIPDPLRVREELKRVDGDASKLQFGFKLAAPDHVQWFKPDYVPGEGWIFKERDEEYHSEREYFTALNEQVKDYDREIIADELLNGRFPVAGYDFDKPTKKPVLLVKGGRGGMGNMHFLTGDIRNPRFSKQGRRGFEEFFMFELKLLADLGLVGLPNAGKSTLLRAISRATPRVGHWEFTTLQPTVGTIFHRIDEEPFTVADIPGIIKGASENRGMGMDFLRHIERSEGIVFVVSLESSDPSADLLTLIDEIGPKRMANKNVLVIATKADLTENGKSYRKLADHIHSINPHWLHIPVCAPQKANIDKAIEMMAQLKKMNRTS